MQPPEPKFPKKYTRELKQLGIKSTPTFVAKGWRSNVFKAELNQKNAALKVTTAQTARKESDLLQAANAVGVGPKFYNATKHIVAMQFLTGKRYSDWIETATNKQAYDFLQKALAQAFRLDQAGISHGQISTADKHVIVQRGKPYLLDFEKGSFTENPRNLPALLNYFFLNPNSFIAKTTRAKLNIRSKQMKQYAQRYTSIRRDERSSVFHAIQANYSWKTPNRSSRSSKTGL